jgi:thiol:disulfide interchange protein
MLWLKTGGFGWSSAPSHRGTRGANRRWPGMDAVMAFFSGTGGLIAGACVAAFLAGWFLLRRNARKLKETS